MSMRIAELAALWSKEREEYRRSEVGSGVQRFVWEVLNSPDLFDLKQGLKSTSAHKRRAEFLLEQSNKSGQADAVIFMDAEVIIPVEVERLENAESGEWQILKYRSAFEKKYGILTDGREWRFYYGDITDKQHYLFHIEEMLEHPRRFQTFWQEYVKPESYYLSLFEDVGQQQLAFAKGPKPVDKHRDSFFRDVTEIIRKLKDKLLNAGYLKRVSDAGERERKATEIAYSYLIQFVLYKTLVDNSFESFEQDFAKKSEQIHKNLKKGSYNSVLMILDGLGSLISENIYKPFLAEQEVIIEEVRRIVHAGEENVMSAAPFLDIFSLIKSYDFGNVRNDVFGVIYENYLKELYADQNLGQFFTDPSVVDFMLQEVGYTASELRKRDTDHISIIDPSCGSGTFLYSAARELLERAKHDSLAESQQAEADVVNNVFGLDIAEFPLYLAEMGILMKMLPIIVGEKYNNPVDKKLKLFMTDDSIAEFIDGIGKRVARTPAHKQMVFQYQGFMRDAHDVAEMKSSLNVQGSGKKTIPRRRFDFVVGNPPYIGYNECAGKGLKTFKLLKQQDVSLSDIYGWNLHSAPGRRKKYPPKPNLYAFFVALGFALLKQGGRFCYIVPQTLLTESDYDVLRFTLSHEYVIEKLITFGGHLFVGRGTSQSKQISTSSLILVCSKGPSRGDRKVECIHVPDEGKDLRDVFADIKKNRGRYSKEITQKMLRGNAENWSFITWKPELVAAYEAYKAASVPMSIYSEHAEAEEQFGDRFYFDVGYILDPKLVVSTPPAKGKYIGLADFKDFANYSRFRPRSFYPWSESAIQLPKNAQGYEVLHRKHKVLWEKSRKWKFYYTDQDVLPSMSFSQVIGSNNRNEILFLFALLNSSVTQGIYRSMFELQPEKHGMFVVVKRLKEFVRPPVIDSAERKSIKSRIIQLADEAVTIETETLQDVVKLDTLLQKFDAASVKGGALVLKSGDTDVRVPLGSSKLASRVGEAVAEYLAAHDEGTPIAKRDLRELAVFDHGAQARLFEQIDELFFDLYGFNKKQRAYLRTLVRRDEPDSITEAAAAE
jgi:type I restriction-modification system DNA methylase subunit